MKTEQVRSIFVKTNHFSSHCAESTGHLDLSLLETRKSVLWKTRWSATKTTTTFFPNVQSVSSAGWSLFANAATSILLTFFFLFPMLIILGPTGPAAAIETTEHPCARASNLLYGSYSSVQYFFEMLSYCVF